MAVNKKHFKGDMCFDFRNPSSGVWRHYTLLIDRIERASFSFVSGREKNWYKAGLEKSSEVSQNHDLNRNTHLPILNLECWSLYSLRRSSLFLGYKLKLISGPSTWLNRTLTQSNNTPLVWRVWRMPLSCLKPHWKYLLEDFIAKASFHYTF